jgi:large subunit ribosomal protein L1
VSISKTKNTFGGRPTITQAVRTTKRKEIMGRKKAVEETSKEVAITDTAVETQEKPVETAETLIENSEVVAPQEVTENSEDNTNKKVSKAKHSRGRKYHAVRAKVDKSKNYRPAEAVALIKKLSYSKFVGSLEVHSVVKEVGMSVDLALPHSTGKTVRVAIADPQVLADIEAGKLDFDVLVAHPEYMPKLAKFARVLGPKGLMPNPKNGTLTPNPELKKQELEAGKFSLKTEKKAPLMHLTIGKLDMSDQDLTENLEAVLKALRGKLLKVSIAASMSPSVKVAFDSEE